MVQRMEEDLWRQKSRTTWLTTHDLNTRFSHLSTVIRCRRNSLDALKTSSGQWIWGRADIGNYFVQHFQQVFKFDNPEVFTLLEELITHSDADMSQLVTIPGEVEIKTAVFQIGASKAPDPNGMTELFYQHY